MKKTSICIFVIIFCNIFSQEKEIKKLLLQQQSDWNAGDLESYMQGYWKNDSLTFIGSKGPQYGWKNTLDMYKKSYPDTNAMGVLSFSKEKIKPFSKTHAFVSGQWQLTRKNDILKGSYSLVLQKIKGKWVIIYDHSS